MPDCFYALSGRSCEETDRCLLAVGANETARPSGPAVGGAAWMAMRNTPHARGADQQLWQFYTTQRVVDMASDYLASDLLVHGMTSCAYDLWEGRGGAHNSSRRRASPSLAEAHEVISA